MRSPPSHFIPLQKSVIREDYVITKVQGMYGKTGTHEERVTALESDLEKSIAFVRVNDFHPT